MMDGAGYLVILNIKHVDKNLKKWDVKSMLKVRKKYVKST